VPGVGGSGLGFEGASVARLPAGRPAGADGAVGLVGKLDVLAEAGWCCCRAGPELPPPNAGRGAGAVGLRAGVDGAGEKPPVVGAVAVLERPNREAMSLTLPPPP
jgi:hypothetical protein